jgi:hypothetical protein
VRLEGETDENVMENKEFVRKSRYVLACELAIEIGILFG